MTKEELRAHCEKQVKMCEEWAKGNGREPSGKIYEEHKLILDLIKALEQQENKGKVALIKPSQNTTTLRQLMQPTSEDCVSRKAMLNAITEIDNNVNMDIYTNEVREIINALPPVTPKLPTSDDCVSRADARHLIAESFRKNLLGITFNKMFETLYKGINDLPPVTPTQRWIPVSEELPKDRDWYLGIFREHDTGWINRLPFVCDYVGKETKATTKEFWILHGFTDMDNPCDYYKNLECVAWKPLPKP